MLATHSPFKKRENEKIEKKRVSARKKTSFSINDEENKTEVLVCAIQKTQLTVIQKNKNKTFRYK